VCGCNEFMAATNLPHPQQQSNLQAEMEAEKQMCNTKKRALQIATDELANNHDTIRTHDKIVDKLKKRIQWRSLVMIRMNAAKNLLNGQQQQQQQ